MYYIVGDSGFPLRENCLTPYNRAKSLSDYNLRGFNYNLSKMRVKVEHLFGRMKNRWRWFMFTSRFKSGEKNVLILESLFVLNNVLIKTKDMESPEDYLDAEEAVEIILILE